MGQSHSFDDAEHATTTPTTGVPMLDWPSDLFSDNISLTDLVTVDIAYPGFLPPSQQIEEVCIQIAA